jgi:TPR repeat protein
MQQYQDSITHDNGGASGSGNPVVDDLSRQLNVKLTVDDDVPENVQRFNKMKELSVDDYNSNGQFNPQIQLDWVTILLEHTGDETFMKTYNINGEKLSKELTHQEVKKNEHIFIKQAIKLLKKITSVAKTPDSQFLLGSLYSNSPIIKIGRPNILEKNYEKSFGYYQKAASQGHPLALYRLAVSYELGIGTAVNETKALDCFIKSANLKCVPSMFKLGIIYSRGALRALRSAKYSYYWFEKASEFASVENPHALFELAKIYERDFPFLAKGVTPTPSDIEYLTELDRLGIFKDDKRAIFYYKEASRFKYPPAQYKLGWCYEYGRLDCVIDAKKSIGWYSRSASQGYPSAEMALSGWYLTGAKGILEPNDKEAYLWASKAASVGFAKAEYAIGYYCEVGLGCDVDLEKSRKFYIRAATQGHNKAIERLKRFRK